MSLQRPVALYSAVSNRIDVLWCSTDGKSIVRTWSTDSGTTWSSAVIAESNGPAGLAATGHSGTAERIALGWSDANGLLWQMSWNGSMQDSTGRWSVSLQLNPSTMNAPEVWAPQNFAACPPLVSCAPSSQTQSLDPEYVIRSLPDLRSWRLFWNGTTWNVAGGQEYGLFYPSIQANVQMTPGGAPVLCRFCWSEYDTMVTVSSGEIPHDFVTSDFPQGAAAAVTALTNRGASDPVAILVNSILPPGDPDPLGFLNSTLLIQNFRAMLPNLPAGSIRPETLKFAQLHPAGDSDNERRLNRLILEDVAAPAIVKTPLQYWASLGPMQTPPTLMARSDGVDVVYSVLNNDPDLVYGLRADGAFIPPNSSLRLVRWLNGSQLPPQTIFSSSTPPLPGQPAVPPLPPDQPRTPPPPGTYFPLPGGQPDPFPPPRPNPLQYGPFDSPLAISASGPQHVLWRNSEGDFNDTFEAADGSWTTSTIAAAYTDEAGYNAQVWGASPPGGVLDSQGNVHAFWVGTDGRLYTASRTAGGTWQAPTALGPVPAAPVPSLPTENTPYVIKVAHGRPVYGQPPNYWLTPALDGLSVTLTPAGSTPAGMAPPYWRFKQTSPGVYNIEALANVGRGQILSCNGDDGAVNMWNDVDTSGRQQWQIQSVDLTSFTIAVSGGVPAGRYLTANASALAVLAAADYSSLKQRWSFEPAPPAVARLPVEGTTYVVKAVQGPPSSPTWVLLSPAPDGSYVNLYPPGPTPAGMPALAAPYWWFDQVSPGLYNIKAAANISGGQLLSGGGQPRVFMSNSPQQWQLQYSPDVTSFTIALTVATTIGGKNLKADQSANAVLAAADPSSLAQRWILEPSVWVLANGKYRIKAMGDLFATYLGHTGTQADGTGTVYLTNVPPGNDDSHFVWDFEQTSTGIYNIMGDGLYFSCQSNTGAVNMWGTDDTSGRQKWQVELHEDGTYTIAVSQGVTTGRDLSAAVGFVFLSPRDNPDSPTERWRIEPVS
jgi:hypothetical protein